MFPFCKLRNVFAFVLSVFFLWLISAAAPIFAQDFKVSNNKRRATVPFRLIRNMIVIQLQINHKGPYNFILDTGCGVMLVTDPLLLDSLDLKFKKHVKIMGLGEGNDLDAWMVAGMDVQINGVEGKNISAAILGKDVLSLSAFAGIPIHGLIGYDFFNSFPVKVNFADSTITAFGTQKIKGWKKSSHLPLLIEDKKPYINAYVNFTSSANLPVKLIVDLGAGHPLSIENGWNDNGEMPEKYIAEANLGIGLSGMIGGYMSRVHVMKLGNFHFNGVVTAFPDSCSAQNKNRIVKRDGSIGLDLLKRFDILFDYQQNLMCLKPNYIYKKPFEQDMSGMEYFAAGKNYKRIIVNRVEPGSAADHCGIEKDDEIVAINFKAVSKMNLQEIDEILRSKDDRTLLMEIARQNVVSRVLLTLKRRI